MTKTLHPLNRCGRTLVCAGMVAVSCVAASPVWAANKCVAADGKVTYQDAPCPMQATQGTVRAPVQSAPLAKAAGKSNALSGTASSENAASGPAQGDDRLDATLLPLVSTQALYDVCVRASPDFAAKYADAMQAWHAQQAAALAQYGRSGRYQELMRNAQDQQRERFGTADDALARFCLAQAGPALRRLTANE